MSGSWQHLTVIKNTGFLNYSASLNTSSLVPLTFDHKTNSGVFEIDEISSWSNYSFTGSLDDIRINNKALTLEEISTLYNTPGTMVQKEYLQAHWNFETFIVSGSLNSSYIGHNFTINNPQVPTSFNLTSTQTKPSFYSSSIMKVINSSNFVPRDPFYINDSVTDPPTLVPAPLSLQEFTASYQDLPTQSTSSVNYFSFADIRIDNLRTFSGDVYKVKVYAKSAGSLGDFELIYDSPLEAEELLYDESNTVGLGSLGYFINQDRINNFWELYQTGAAGDSAGTLTKDDTFIIDSMKISGMMY
jgi:hypothetical protein